MNTVIAWGFALVLCAAAAATEPPVAASKAVPPARPSAAIPQRSAETAKPLKLSLGDVRKYMMPNEFRAAVSPESDRATIVVEGARATAPLKSTQPLPQGLGAVYSVFRHPTSAWRMFLPDPRGVPPGPPDVVPAREFRWGP